MEAKIEQADATVARWEAALTDPATTSDPAKLTEAWNNAALAREAAAALYARWEKLEERK